MHQGSLYLEYDKARFPIRFVVTALLCLICIWLIEMTKNWLAPINQELLIAHVGLVTIFCGICLGVLKFFGDAIATMRGNLGIVSAWVLVVLVAGTLYLIVYLTSGQAGSDWSIPYLRLLDGRTMLLLVGISAVVALPLFWVEKQVFSARALVKASELSQFSNLAFRIRPHFLFNTLNSVAHLISLHPARAEKALYNLADVFRVVLADKRELVPLKAELELAEKYLYLEKTRLGERLKVASRIDPEALGVQVPVLMLQPLLENAVYHGIETRFKGGTIDISVQVIEKQLILQIANPLPEGSIKRGSGNKVAQENLRDRIYKTFGSRGTFDAHEGDDRYTVTIRLPL